MLELMAAGRTTVEIGRCLDLPAPAVRARLVRLMAKLGAGSRLEALIIAVRRGLIDLPPA